MSLWIAAIWVEDIEACVKAGMKPYVSKPDRGPAKSDDLFTREAFSFDAENNRQKCAGEKFLRLGGTGALRDGVRRRTYDGYSVCHGCALRPHCTKSKFRQLTRYGDEAELPRMATRVAANLNLQDIRHQTVEHPFGKIKQGMNMGAFLVRRVKNVRGEFSLTAFAHNLCRTITLIGIPGLRARWNLFCKCVLHRSDWCASCRTNRVCRNHGKAGRLHWHDQGRFHAWRLYCGPVRPAT